MNIEVVKSLRDLLKSAKNGLLISEIEKDYMQMENKEIPYQSLGYKTLKHFLQEHFNVLDTKNGEKVFINPQTNSPKRQTNKSNSVGGGKKKIDSLPAQRALRSTTIKNDWNGTVYSSVDTKSPNRSLKKLTQSYKNKSIPFQNGSSIGYNNSTRTSEMRPILKQSNIIHVPRTEEYGEHGEHDDQSNFNSNPPLSRVGPKMQNYPKRSSDFGTRSSVQSRLAIQKKLSTESIEPVQSNVNENQSDCVAAIDDKMKNVEIKQALPFVPEISVYSQRKGYAEPQYTYSQTKSRKFTCKVTIGSATYASYPHEFNNKEEAQIEAARIAYQSIKEIEYSEKYPTCMDCTTEIAYKIFECISENGVFLKFIPQIFQERYDLTLPNEWLSIIYDNTQLFIVIKDSLMDRVYPNISQLTPKKEVCEPDSNKARQLSLPWNDNYWNVFITSVSSTVEIWGRLIGPDYSVKLDSILDDIETDIVTGKPKKVSNSVEVGEFYYITNPDCYRVRIEKVDGNRRMALCFLIDYGDEEWWSLDQIYEGDEKLFQLSPQAIRFSLFNLEDFAENPNSKQEIDEYLAGKTLIAEIKSTQSEYLIQSESATLDLKIKAIFYDTSGDDDIQLNKLILERICENAEPPHLQRSKWNAVYISYISDTGDIYCQLHSERGNTVHNINQLIHRLTQNGIDPQYRTFNSNTTIPFTELHLVYDENDRKWYRVLILEKEPALGNDIELCKYVDYGMTKPVDRKNIYRLELLSKALSTYPKQAILLKLNDIYDFNSRIISRLRGLLCPTATVLVQIAGSASQSIPLVNICKRLENNILCNINDTIRMEEEIENTYPALTNINEPLLTNRQTPGEKDIMLYPEPNLEQFFSVIVVTAPNPSNFFVRPCSEESKFKEMMSQLQELCNKSVHIVKNELRTNDYFAGLLPDGYWYRIKIQSVLHADTVAVYKCDFGDINILNIDSIRFLPSDYRKLPQLAIPAKLHGIQPKNIIWNDEDSAYFQKLTVEKQFVAEIKAIRKDMNSYQKILLDVNLVDVSATDDINVNQRLVMENHAKFSEEDHD